MLLYSTEDMYKDKIDEAKDNHGKLSLPKKISHKGIFFSVCSKHGLWKRVPQICFREEVKNNKLCKRLRTHKVFTKDQTFYLYYHKFSINHMF